MTELLFQISEEILLPIYVKDNNVFYKKNNIFYQYFSNGRTLAFWDDKENDLLSEGSKIGGILITNEIIKNFNSFLKTVLLFTYPNNITDEISTYNFDIPSHYFEIYESNDTNKDILIEMQNFIKNKPLQIYYFWKDEKSVFTLKYKKPSYLILKK